MTGLTRKAAMLGGAGLLALLAALPAAAQDGDVDEDVDTSFAVVQPLRTVRPGAHELDAALTRLSRNPSDLSALIDAGNAALLLDDTGAALGFLGRAQQLDPRNAAVKAGLGIARLRGEDPYAALRLFEEAEQGGAPVSRFVAERALAHDLVGDNARAQADYRAALAIRRDDETIRRYAVSLAIAGDRKAAEAQLAPLLQKADPAAWRTRTFVYALTGGEDEAVSIAYATLPQTLAQGIAPYLRYMPRLTRAQQAAAANLGHFPRAADIGREDPRNVRLASAAPAATAAAPPPDKSKRRRPGRREREAERAAQAEAPPPQVKVAAVATTAGIRTEGEAATRQLATPSVAPLPPASATPAPAPAFAPVTPSAPAQAPVQIAAQTAMPPARAAAVPAVASPAPSPVPSASVAVGTAPQPGLASVPPAGAGASSAAALQATPPAAVTTLAASGASPAAAVGPPGGPTSLLPAALAAGAQSPASSSAGASQPLPAEPVRTFAELFADLEAPRDEQARDARAVDLAAITPSRPKPPPPAKPPADAKPAAEAKPKAAPVKPAPPKHPARHWAQVAGGANVAALPREWKRLAALAPAAFKGRKGHTTPLRATNRLLAGPFDSAREAQAFVNEVGKAGIEAFAWTSAEGQEIKPLPG